MHHGSAQPEDQTRDSPGPASGSSMAIMSLAVSEDSQNPKGTFWLSMMFFARCKRLVDPALSDSYSATGAPSARVAGCCGRTSWAQGSRPPYSVGTGVGVARDVELMLRLIVGRPLVGHFLPAAAPR